MNMSLNYYYSNIIGYCYICNFDLVQNHEAQKSDCGKSISSA